MHLPRSPIISSHYAGWNGISLEYHRQPAHEMPEYCIPYHTLSIGLGYRAKEFKVNGRVHKDFVAGNVGICPANQSLSTQAYGKAEFILLTVDPTKFAQTAYEAVNTEKLEIVSQIRGFDPLIYQMSLALKHELESNELDSQLYAESMATALSVHLLKRYSARKQVIKNYTGGLPQYKLREAVTYINEHLEQKLTLAEIADLLQMSPHYFATLFKQSTGLAPHQYITQCRIEQAKRLLTNRELTLIEICQQVGFQSQSHFTKVFRKYTATTPKVYRKLL
ncbi:helix-turn-helix transcriptional regulator [Gloeocapsopsis crepidinum LEGE 06123]|uniref:Helix-turn-helix transcriptional regulator n=1 Tax=Gloeocapsopsis crepidinum LEGE 06123 TaxID=588587 RepID=A0ABR9UQB4_9CHRO|nr:AraC family transcriptional regulator [Gloeocapsopsis crepidinum]MBE9190472.1 helix-turn-helix transcriptional regulator [Gloeocapsopsis crepidinum LEGE 06123]